MNNIWKVFGREGLREHFCPSLSYIYIWQIHFFLAASSHVGSWILHQGLNSCPLHWKSSPLGILTTGPTKSRNICLKKYKYIFSRQQIKGKHWCTDTDIYIYVNHFAVYMKLTRPQINYGSIKNGVFSLIISSVNSYCMLKF